MKTNTIITIGREYGSAGREIGYKVAEAFDIKLYDKEMLARAAKESGICEEIFQSHDEKPTNSFLYSLVMDTYSMGYSGNSYTDMPINHKVFLAQFDAIKKIADEGPCILVGRCADYALESYPNVVSVFIHADMQSRIRRIARLYDLTDAKAKDLIVKTDKKRASYYNYYTNKKWSDAESYELCLTSSELGIEGTAQAIIDYVTLKEKIGKESRKI
ncbi:cytidylate kinase-like family protein [Lachnoclostridium sp. An76]|uniref:cytidylate kinase-like family protein n=1 Tax=Lachnoclostridium sp. An76 TaxID=1965654 RepID=UPI000B381E56|nr:cytidylate kinase-like family protein [Lachnoclostridium sp. An76]OUN35783.1 cytidylate kinase [Lachnoclostridium sp. An76]